MPEPKRANGRWHKYFTVGHKSHGRVRKGGRKKSENSTQELYPGWDVMMEAVEFGNAMRRHLERQGRALDPKPADVLAVAARLGYRKVKRA